MQLIVLTPEQDIARETDIVNELFANGLQRLHLRKPGATANEYRDYLGAIDSTHHDKIVIHGFFELLEEYQLAGIHLNSMLRGNAAVLDQLSRVAPSKISTSFHNWQEVRDNEFEYGYIFISPVFDSISKPGHKAAIEPGEVADVRKYNIQHKKYCPGIIGLGGVEEPHIKVLRNAGFDGAAVLGGVWQSADPVLALQYMLTTCRKVH